MPSVWRFRDEQPDCFWQREDDEQPIALDWTGSGERVEAEPAWTFLERDTGWTPRPMQASVTLCP